MFILSSNKAKTRNCTFYGSSLLCGILLFFVLPTALWATDQEKQLSDESSQSPWQKTATFVVGQPAEDSVYLGMLSYHFVDDDDDYQSNHYLVGVTYKGFYGGIFENSWGATSWSAGVQRDVYSTTKGVLHIKMGYRLGLLYGYDNMGLFNTELFFPMVQLYSDVQYKKVGIQFAWAGSALTAGFFFRF